MEVEDPGLKERGGSGSSSDSSEHSLGAPEDVELLSPCVRSNIAVLGAPSRPVPDPSTVSSSQEGDAVLCAPSRHMPDNSTVTSSQESSGPQADPTPVITFSSSSAQTDPTPVTYFSSTSAQTDISLPPTSYVSMMVIPAIEGPVPTDEEYVINPRLEEDPLGLTGSGMINFTG